MDPSHSFVAASPPAERRTLRRQSSARVFPIFSQQSSPSHAGRRESSALDDVSSPKKRGLFGSRKSFSGIRSHHFADLKNGLHTAATSVRQALHKDRSAAIAEDDQDADMDVARRRQPMRRRSTTLLLSRPWTSHPFPFGPSSKDASAPPRPETGRSREASTSFMCFDPAQGAAARQAAREHGQAMSFAGAKNPADHFWVHHERDRESGVSLSMDMGALAVADDQMDGHVDDRDRLMDPFHYLPQELVSYILSCLDIADVLRAERVSRHWQRLSKDPLLRRGLFLSQWANPKHADVLPGPVGGQGLGKAGVVDQDWASMYRVRRELAERWRKGPTESQAQAIYLNGHQDSVYCVQFDERFVITGSRDRTIRIWDIRTGELLRIIGVSHARDVDRMASAVIANQQTLTGPMNIVNPTPRTDDDMYYVPDVLHNASILCLQYDKDILVTGSSDCSLIVWDLHTWQPIRKLSEHRAGVLDIAFDDVKIVSCSKDGTICVWDRVNGTLLSKLTGHRGPVNAVQMRGDRVVSASGEGCAKLWELRISNAGTSSARCRSKCIRDFWSRDKGLACVEFSADGHFVLAGGNDKVIYKFAAETGSLVEMLEGHKQLVRSLYLDGVNGRVVSGSYDLDLRCWGFEGMAPGPELWCLEKWSSSWILSAKSDYRRLVTTSQDGRAMIIDFGAGIQDVGLLEA